MDAINIIESACDKILSNEIKKAQEIIKKDYKHNFITYETRAMSSFEKLKIFLRDGFIDRYTGGKLIFPNVLRIMSEELGNDIFPYHTNWMMSKCHIAYWEYFPTYDHIIPIARGGKDVSDNIVTTSQKRNSAKSNFLIEEIGYTLHEKGNLSEWDGMISWYMKYIENHKDILEKIDNKSNNVNWHKALLKCIEEGYFSLST